MRRSHLRAWVSGVLAVLCVLFCAQLGPLPSGGLQAEVVYPGSAPDPFVSTGSAPDSSRTDTSRAAGAQSDSRYRNPTPGGASQPVSSGGRETRPATISDGTSVRIRPLLSGTSARVYDAICEAVAQMQAGLIPLGVCSEADITLAYHAVSADHPEFFWMPFGYVRAQDSSGQYIGFEYRSASAQMSYLCTRAQRERMERELEQAAAQAESLLRTGMNEYERELALHDWLTSRCTYAHGADQNEEPMAFTIYGALVEGSAVCEGYARGMQYLLARTGIACSLVWGESEGEGHMWNIVRIDGTWYHLDPTWNDSSDAGYHTFFNLPEVSIRMDRTIDPDYDSLSPDALESGFNVALPACNSEQANFCAVNGTLIESGDVLAQVVTSGLAAAARQGKTSAEFAFSAGYGRRLESTAALHGELMELGCVEAANRSLPQGMTISRNRMVLTGVKYSTGFKLSWG